jgi:hypothetical protein
MMADITITIADDKLQERIEDFALVHNYQDQIEDDEGNFIPNPQSKAQFAKMCIKNYIKKISEQATITRQKELQKVAVETINQETDLIVVS